MHRRWRDRLRERKTGSAEKFYASYSSLKRANERSGCHQAPFLVGLATDVAPLLDDGAVAGGPVRIIQHQPTVAVHDIVVAVSGCHQAPFLVGLSVAQAPLLDLCPVARRPARIVQHQTAVAVLDVVRAAARS